MSVRQIKWSTSKGLQREGWLADYKDTKGVRRSKLFARKKDAQVFHDKAKVDVRGRVHVADRDKDNVTIADAGKYWLESGDGLEASTLRQRRQHLELHIEPFLGRMKLNATKVPEVRRFLDQLRAGDESLPDGDPRRRARSPQMVKAVQTSLGSLLADAAERGLSTGNAVRDMGRARASRSKADSRHDELAEIGVHIPTVAEVNSILSKGSRVARVFLTTAALTGMRASELRGLRWGDVDLAKGEIAVRQRADADNQMGSPKTKAGRRRIPIGKKLINTLREWRLECPRPLTANRDEKGQLVPEPTHPAHLVFPTKTGTVMWHANVIKQWVLPPQIEAQVVVDSGEKDVEGKPVFEAKYTGLHAFRHFYASFCINPKEAGGLGLQPKEVQHRLGHSSIQMTLDVYGHLFPRGEASDLDAAESALLSQESKNAEA